MLERAHFVRDIEIKTKFFIKKQNTLVRFIKAYISLTSINFEKTTTAITTASLR